MGLKSMKFFLLLVEGEEEMEVMGEEDERHRVIDEPVARSPRVGHQDEEGDRNSSWSCSDGDDEYDIVSFSERSSEMSMMNI